MVTLHERVKLERTGSFKNSTQMVLVKPLMIWPTLTHAPDIDSNHPIRLPVHLPDLVLGLAEEDRLVRDALPAVAP